MEEKPKYSSLSDSDSHTEVDEESWPLAGDGEGTHYQREKTKWYNKPLPWMISTACLFVVVIALVAIEWHSRKALVSTRDLSIFEWKGARDAIKTRYVKFSSGLVYNETGDLVRTRNENELDWVGTPTEEMDKAWESITSPQDLFATKDEVKDLGPDEYLIPQFGLYEVEFEVFHDLHCLNMHRKMIYIDHYPEMKSDSLMTHIDHCIDTIRQSMMCHGNLTPIPIIWSENKHRLMPDFENRHLCRDFPMLKKWAKTRDANEPGLRDEIAMRLNGTHA